MGKGSLKAKQSINAVFRPNISEVLPLIICACTGDRAFLEHLQPKNITQHRNGELLYSSIVPIAGVK